MRGGGRRGSLTSGVGLSGGGAARAAGPCGPWKERGGSVGAARVGPEWAQPRGGRVFLFFLFSISFFPFSILVSFYSLFLLNQ
jgi:hypothetical protein